MPKIVVRQDAWKLKTGDKTLEWYARGVAAMKARPATDPTSWTYQAAMHGSVVTPAQPLWNGCQHGSWYFVSWHRMYVYYFETIVRAAVVAAGGPDDWALPYWNYTEPTTASIPLPFRDPTSSLYVVQRRTVDGDVNAGWSLPAAATDVGPALRTIPFVPPGLPISGFGGQVVKDPIHFNRGFGALEQLPHNAVHNAVGGPGGWMTDPNTAAADPIFWLHHSNIDRLWSSWLKLADGRADTNEKDWTHRGFRFFDATGHQVEIQTQNIVPTEDLFYRFDRLEPLPPILRRYAAVAAGSVAASSATPGPVEIVGGTSAPVVLTGRPAAAVVPIDARARTEALAATGAQRPNQVFLALDDITAAADPGTIYEVLVNAPDNPSAQAADDHRAGTLSFFGIAQAADPEGDSHVHPYNVAFDITDLAGWLQAENAWDADRLDVSFRPLGLDPPEGAAPVTIESSPEHLPVSVGRISVHYG